jgi:tRNA pseudouridine55 synthase
VLLIALGKATRLLEYLSGQEKSYRAVVRLGQRRDTLDREGILLDTRPVPALSRASVEAALARFRGSILQVPPVYSALKVGGVPLHRRVRRGETVEPAPRTVTFEHLEVTELRGADLVLEIRCSAGTYVRSLARDLGDALGTGAVLWDLVRTRSGEFDLAAARSLDDVEAARDAAWNWVYPPESMIAALPRRRIAPEEVSALAAGRTVRGDAPPGTVAVLDEQGRLVAIVQAGDGLLRPTKVFWEAA